MKVPNRVIQSLRSLRLRFDVARYRIRIRIRPSHRAPETAIEKPNTIFSRARCEEVRGHIERMAAHDGYLLERVADTRIQGVRTWEYGTLLGTLSQSPDRASWAAIDIGSGNSTFPLYLVESANVGSMVALDLPEAHEQQTAANQERERTGGVVRVSGSMLELPFADGQFDLVTCISAIEHLDGDPNAGGQLDYDAYLERTRVALAEMLRVVRPGGHVYVTTDTYLPDLQKTDAWAKSRAPGPIWSAYRYEDIAATFIATVEANGGRLDDSDYGHELLETSADRATYRGRYFTTFAIWATKREPGNA